MYAIFFSKQAEKDKKLLVAAGLERKARDLLAILMQNPLQSPPRYEALVGNLAGFYSRRINIQHRLVYQILDEPQTINGVAYEGLVKIARMWTHYA